MRWSVALLLSLTAACSGASSDLLPQAADGGGDAAPKVDLLQSPDVTGDAPADAPVDAPVDAPADLPLDRAMDAAAPLDAAADVLREASVDVANDASVADVTRTTLRVRYNPGTTAIALRGSVGPLNWDRGVEFRRVADDTWEWTSTDLSMALEWKPLLDDRTWSRGPNYRAQPGSTVVVFPHFVTGVGEYSRAVPSFMSTVLGNRRGLWIYLPPSYIENTRARFPVVYMHDGQNLFDPRAAFGGVVWNAHTAMNDGAESASIREAIIVGVENNADRIDEYTPTRDAMIGGGGRGDVYLRMLIEEVKPLIDRTYRTLPERENTALVGSSLGGLISAYAGVRHASVFGLIGALSPSTWWDNRMILNEVSTTAMRTSRPLRVYVDSGDGGTSRDGVDDTRELAARYRAAGYMNDRDLRYTVQAGGQHNERYWAMRLPGALAFLLGPRDQ